jgi:hypothetical protein
VDEFYFKVYVEGATVSTQIGVTFGPVLSFPVRDVTSDICIQAWSAGSASEPAILHRFIGQAILPMRHLCAPSPSTSASAISQTLSSSGKPQNIWLRLWPLRPEAAKFQSGIRHMKGSAMKRLVAATAGGGGRSGGGGSGGGGGSSSTGKNVGDDYAGDDYDDAQEYVVPVTVCLKLDKSLPACLLNGRPYKISPGSQDPAASAVIDWYYLKKGILRMNAILQGEPRWVAGMRVLRSWANPVMSALFMCAVVALWWNVNSPVWIPFACSLFIVGSSLFTVAARSAAWPPSTQGSDDDTAAASKLGRVSPIIWQEDVGVDPEDLLAKLKSVHGLLSHAARPLNQYASLIEKISNAFGGSDPAITVAANGIVLMSGVAMSAVVWVVGCVGFHNVSLLVFLVGMTPPSLTAAVISKRGGTEGEEQAASREGGGGVFSKIIINLVGLFERVPDEDEIVHRRIADAQIVMSSPASKTFGNNNGGDGIQGGGEEETRGELENRKKES